MTREGTTESKIPSRSQLWQDKKSTNLMEILTSFFPRPRTVNSIWFKAGKLNKKQKGPLIKTWGIQHRLSATQCQPEFPSIHPSSISCNLFHLTKTVSNKSPSQIAQRDNNSTTSNWKQNVTEDSLGKEQPKMNSGGFLHEQCSSDF